MAKSEVRVDKYLWATRIFKTRTIATEACKKGRVEVNGSSIKPSRTVKVGDKIDVRKPPITYTFAVLALAEKRMGAKLVPEYIQNNTPQSQYAILEMTQLSGYISRQKGAGRPTKREGRDLKEYIDNEYQTGYPDLDFGDDFFEE